jgi:23S rRNA (pseudouridine1915-N3)-methyltransferase
MKLRFIWVGKTRNTHYRELTADYMARLSHFAQIETAEVKDGGGAGEEGQRILQKLNPNSFVCLLDVIGRQISSHEFADEIAAWQNRSLKEICFVIGGADGVSREVAHRADYRLSLSFLTFTHEMARVLIVEQVYRAFTILRGFPYQK